MKNTIKELTKDCHRQKCAIRSEGASTTLIGWSQTYDKDGNPIGQDPNVTTHHFRCVTCGRQWAIKK